MPKPTRGKRLGGGPSHERLMLANLATALFEHGRITSTETKVKRLRPFAERLITKAKRGDLHARRQVHAVIRDKSVVHRLFAELGPNYAARPGGYTRITKLGPRKGDNAPLAAIELVEPMPESATTSAGTATAAGASTATESATTGAAAPAAPTAVAAPAAASGTGDDLTDEPVPDTTSATEDDTGEDTRPG